MATDLTDKPHLIFQALNLDRFAAGLKEAAVSRDIPEDTTLNLAHQPIMVDTPEETRGEQS